jgi:hypothetical protein
MLPANQRFLTVTSPGVDAPAMPIYAAPPAGPPETRYRDPLHAHLADVSAVEMYVSLPAEWLAIRDRWSRLVASAFPCRDQLATAVSTGVGDLDTLAAMALAETQATSGTAAEVRQHVGAAVHAALTSSYKPIAKRVYKTIADLFDSAADDHRRDELVAVLVPAARLAGATADVGAYATHQLGLSLTVDPQRAHKRRLYEAFPNRQTLRDLGGRIRANSDPLAEAWRLPDIVKVFDPNHVLREWDPLDGPLPPGWTGSVEGWLEQGSQLWA